MTTAILDENGLNRAADIILNGGLVAVPTETVYGLAACGLKGEAVAKIYEVKGRPGTRPISLLISDMKQAEKLCRDIPKEAYALAEAFWPGPLTMILKKADCVPDIVTAGGDTVGVRCPDHKLTLKIIDLADAPLAAPSANPFGKTSPKDFESVLDYFDGKIEGAVDGGRCSVGIESTIVDMTVRPFKILRQGGLDKEKIEDVLKAEVSL